MDDQINNQDIDSQIEEILKEDIGVELPDVKDTKKITDSTNDLVTDTSLDEKNEKNEIEKNEKESNVDVADSKDRKEKNRSDMKDFKDVEFKLDSLNLGKNSILGILDDVRIIKKRIAHIENVLREQERSQYSPARDLPGVNGKYDGLNMITADGKKIEVPVNYAAKSLLVYGDELKRIEEDGKHAFKIIKKVDRKKIEGVLSKKDGKYVVLSDVGTFNLHKSAVEFRNIKQGEWVQAFIPESGPANDFAAIDKVIAKEKGVKMFEVKTTKPDTPQVKPFVKPENLPPRMQNPQQNRPQDNKSQNISTQNKPYENRSSYDNKPSQPQQPVAPTPPASPMPKITFSDEDLV